MILNELAVKLTNEAEDLKKRLEEVTIERDELKKALKEPLNPENEELNRLKQQLNESTAENNQLKSQISDLMEATISGGSEPNLEELEKDSLRAEVEKLRAENVDLRKKHEADYEEETSRLSGIIKEYENEKAVLELEIQTLRERAEESQDQLEDLKKELERRKTEDLEAEDTITNLEVRKKRLEKDLEQQKALNKKLSAESISSNRLNEMKKAITELENAKKDLEEQLKEEQITSTSFENMNGALADAVDKLEKKITAMEKSHKQSEKSLETILKSAPSTPIASSTPARSTRTNSNRKRRRLSNESLNATPISIDYLLD
ncbi:hypothetical protein L596_030277 [Steinernema carpocapsae]|uniref:Myosin tail domain-containing protein n=1 Tax=Steinernema carpocapsae TaxID=34508 RepID=A0A4U5LNX7_STECR|nr:hypothetical protein L596_030277 [Steinernema carpocapsae]